MASHDITLLYLEQFFLSYMILSFGNRGTVDLGKAGLLICSTCFSRGGGMNELGHVSQRGNALKIRL